MEFTKIDDNGRRWLNEFRAKPFSVPGKLEDVECMNSSLKNLTINFYNLFPVHFCKALSFSLNNFRSCNVRFMIYD